MTPDARIRFLKDEAERCWRAGDMKGFAEYEALLESWRMWEQMQRDDQEKQHAQR